MALARVVDRAFHEPRDDGYERGWDEDIQRFEIRADADDQDREVREIADRMDRGFADALVVDDRQKRDAEMIREHRERDRGGERKAVRIEGKETQGDVLAEDAEAGIEVGDFALAEVLGEAGDDPFAIARFQIGAVGGSGSGLRPDAAWSGLKVCRIPYRTFLRVIRQLNRKDSEGERNDEKSQKENSIDRSQYCAANRKRYVD